jgi:asparagine synthase (glutamine-hydrolysing)
MLGEAGSGELQAMATRLEHRGSESAHWSPVLGLWLGMRGSGAAVQVQRGGPIAFDGAIDNRRALARRLGRREDHPQPAGDGALAAELWAVLGEEGLSRIAGQFALALWDATGRRLVLARDRVGYAPLYFAVAGERLVFASEYKALLALEVLPARPNRAALQSIQSTKWVRPGVTCLEGVHPVAPGSLMEVQAGRAASRRYWDIPVRAADLDEAGHAARLRESFL